LVVLLVAKTVLKRVGGLAGMMAELKDTCKVEGWVEMMVEYWVDKKEVWEVYKMVALKVE
jgi:hypothetical protein